MGTVLDRLKGNGKMGCCRRWWVAGVLLVCCLMALWWRSSPVEQAAETPVIDHFADALVIPAGLLFSNPLNVALAGGRSPTPKDIASPQTPVHGPSDIELYNTGRQGVYLVRILANPCCAGTLYLKAFEVTKGTPLSADRLKAATSGPFGYSVDTSEKFERIAEIVIREGDAGKPYAARFEAWAVPADGTAEQKLTERVYRIEGSQQ